MTVEKRAVTILAALVLTLGAVAAQAFPPCPAGATCTVVGSFPLEPVTSKDTFTFNLASAANVSFVGYTTDGSASADLLYTSGNEIGGPTLFTTKLTTQTFDDLVSGHYKYVIDGVSATQGAVLHLEEVVTSVPEPATFALLLAALAAAGLVVGRRSGRAGVVVAP